MKTLTVALDADGVLLDIVTPWLAKYNREAGDTLRYEDITTWLWPLKYAEWTEARKDLLRTPDLYAAARPIQGALDGVNTLLDQGHRLVVVTHDFPTHLKSKIWALRYWFPVLEHVVFAKNKRNAVRYDVLVDDAIHNNPEVLFAQPWNNYGTPTWPGQLGALHWPGVVSAVKMHAYSRTH